MELNNGIKVYQFGIEKVLQKYGKNSFWKFVASLLCGNADEREIASNKEK